MKEEKFESRDILLKRLKKQLQEKKDDRLSEFGSAINEQNKMKLEKNRNKLKRKNEKRMLKKENDVRKGKGKRKNKKRKNKKNSFHLRIMNSK